MTTETASMIAAAIQVGNTLVINHFISSIATIIISYVIISFIINLIGNYFTIGFDDTDDKINKKRSGLKVYIDHKTGAQYISIGKSIHPRLDKDGNLIVIEKDV
jgi:hypothetical protein